MLLARGFHLGSAISVNTREGAVVIDTTGARRTATAARDAMREKGAQPARHVVYTHCHFRVLQAEVDLIGQGHQLVGGAADDHIHDLVRKQGVFRTVLGGILGAAATHGHHERVMVGHAWPHAHAHHSSVLVDAAGPRRGNE